MASMVLNSQRAMALSVCVVRAFVEMLGMFANNQALASKVNRHERKVSVHERYIAELVDSMAELLAAQPVPPKRSIGFITLEDRLASMASKTAKLLGRSRAASWCGREARERFFLRAP